jgi:pimeloyl-ACP methyl ester carboxylesterase
VADPSEPVVFVRFREHEMFVVDVGVGDLPVVLHSGWIGTWEDWLPQVEALSRVTRVIAYDHRGTGRTAASPAHIAHEELVRDVFGVLEASDIDRCVVGGFSSGASVVVDAVTARPDVFAGALLMCPVFVDDDPGPNFVASLENDFARTIESFLDACFPEAGRRDVTSVRQWARSVLHQSPPENAVQLMYALRASKPMSAYEPLPLPTAIVMGADDPMSSPVDLPSWTELFPNATTTVIPDTGHIAAFTAADEVNRPFLDLVDRVSG